MVAEGRMGGDEGTVVVSPFSIIEGVDAAVCQLLGYAASDLIGQHGSMLVPREAQPSTAASIDRMRRGEIDVRQGRLLTRDGNEIGVQVRSRQLPDGRLALTLRQTA
jgi:PAS domain S-box-containing protein